MSREVRSRDRARLDSSVASFYARLDSGRGPAELQAQFARIGRPPINADCGVILLASSKEVWTAIVFATDKPPHLFRVASAPAGSWLARVVEKGERFHATHADGEHRGFPWLADATTWLALPLEDGAGGRLGAVAIASRADQDWGVAAERRLLQIVHEAGPELERLCLLEELAKLRSELCVARQEAADARERRDTMLAVLGHELRNPLAPLTNALELIWNRAPPDLHSELSVMDRQLRQIRRLVDDLLDLSRVFRHDLDLELRRVRLRDVFLSAAESLQAMIIERGHALIIDAPPELQIEADEARLTQVVTALLSNSAKHTPPGRRIHMSACELEGSVEIVVEDDGGMNASALASAFDAFAGPTRPPSGAAGLGLGLPIARALVGRHGGEIELRSGGVGCGTTAIVRLPAVCASSSVRAREQRCQPARLPLPHKVLVVDDNRDAADMLADAVRLWGGTAVVAYESPVALELARSTRFDVALVDIAMPQMNGLELARELRRIPGSRDLRIIAVSGFGETADAERSREVGMDAHLVKPVNLQRLLRVLTEVTAE